MSHTARLQTFAVAGDSTHDELVLRAAELLLPPREGNVFLDENDLVDFLKASSDSILISLIEIFETGRAYEMTIVRGRVVGSCQREGDNSRRKQYYKMRRTLAAIPVYREFCNPRHQTKTGLSEYLANLEVEMLRRGHKGAESVRLMPAFAFVECLDFDAMPEKEHAEWIVEHLSELAPYAGVLRDRGDWSREHLQHVIESGIPPVLADGDWSIILTDPRTRGRRNAPKTRYGNFGNALFNSVSQSKLP